MIQGGDASGSIASDRWLSSPALTALPDVGLWVARAQEALGIPGLAIERMSVRALVRDSSDKLLVRGGGGEPRGVILISAPESPDLVARGAARAREIRARLSQPVAAPVLLPAGEGADEGLSWAIYPWREPLFGGSRPRQLAQRLRWSGPLLAWLRELARETRHQPAPAELEHGLVRPLAVLAFHPHPSPPVAVIARAALRALESGRWRPVQVAMHGDLWTGNLLVDPDRSQLSVIDWPGGRLRGWAIYDLLRLALSLDLPRRTLAREVAHHCAIIGDASPEAARWHLAAALGSILATLESFPLDRFARVCDRTLLALERALGA